MNGIKNTEIPFTTVLKGMESIYGSRNKDPYQNQVREFPGRFGNRKGIAVVWEMILPPNNDKGPNPCEIALVQRKAGLLWLRRLWN